MSEIYDMGDMGSFMSVDDRLRLKQQDIDAVDRRQERASTATEKTRAFIITMILIAMTPAMLIVGAVAGFGFESSVAYAAPVSGFTGAAINHYFGKKRP